MVAASNSLHTSPAPLLSLGEEKVTLCQSSDSGASRPGLPTSTLPFTPPSCGSCACSNVPQHPRPNPFEPLPALTSHSASALRACTVPLTLYEGRRQHFSTRVPLYRPSPAVRRPPSPPHPPLLSTVAQITLCYMVSAASKLAHRHCYECGSSYIWVWASFHLLHAALRRASHQTGLAGHDGPGDRSRNFPSLLERSMSSIARLFCLLCLLCNAFSALQVAQLRCSFRQKAGSTCTVATPKFLPGPKVVRHLTPLHHPSWPFPAQDYCSLVLVFHLVHMSCCPLRLLALYV